MRSCSFEKCGEMRVLAVLFATLFLAAASVSAFNQTLFCDKMDKCSKPDQWYSQPWCMNFVKCTVRFTERHLHGMPWVPNHTGPFSG